MGLLSDRTKQDLELAQRLFKTLSSNLVKKNRKRPSKKNQLKLVKKNLDEDEIYILPRAYNKSYSRNTINYFFNSKWRNKKKLRQDRRFKLVLLNLWVEARRKVVALINKVLRFFGGKN